MQIYNLQFLKPLNYTLPIVLKEEVTIVVAGCSCWYFQNEYTCMVPKLAFLFL
jgi:hypothetical protein